MMGRSFYSPLHSMWGSTFGNSQTKQYSSFPYAKDNNENNDYLMGSSGNGSSNEHNMEFKPTSDHLMGLSSYDMHTSTGGRTKMAEGTNTTSSGNSSSAATFYPYYAPAMYHHGANSALSRSSSKPKPKARSNAGKKCKSKS